MKPKSLLGEDNLTGILIKITIVYSFKNLGEFFSQEMIGVIPAKLFINEKKKK